MKFGHYLKDKLYIIILFLIMYLIIFLLFLAFKINLELIIAVSLSLFVFVSLILLIDYLRKRTFYNRLFFNISKLDKAYLVLETIDNPNFYEGQLLKEALYNINKSMAENVKNYEIQMNDFKEFIEMWIHEVKIPISTLVLMAHNHQDKYDLKTLKQIKRIEDYVDEVLYYVRGENAEKDYLINEVSLDKIINNIALKNKDDLLENKIDLLVKGNNYKVYTDSKWLEFILNQIVSNSIKYKKGTSSYIEITTYNDGDKVVLKIKDNGIGIAKSDITKVFNKSFTGKNGRLHNKSTGMGLFIAKNLCQKLGHTIKIESKQNEYTTVYITFFDNKFYEVVK